MSTSKEIKTSDNYNYYSNNNQQNTYGNWSLLTDAVGHTAQGASLGWYDEGLGIIGGTGRVLANGTMRTLGRPVNNESFADAWNKGYRDYRNFARNELAAGYQRHPYISGGTEILGAGISPIKVHNPSGVTGRTLGNFVAHPSNIARSRQINAFGTALINGIGSSDNNTLAEYGWNTGIGYLGNYIGNDVGNYLWGSGNMMYPVGRSAMNAGAQYFSKLWKNEDDEETFQQYY